MSEPLDPTRIPRPLSGPLEVSREATMTALRASFERGDLTLEELDERLELAATATRQPELDVLLRDLGKAAPGASSAPARALPGVPPERLSSVLGVQERAGAWAVPPELHVRAILGGARLDLRDARLGPGVTVIQAIAVLGAITILVPPGLRVEVRGTPLGGLFPRIDYGAPAARGPVLQVRGTAVLGVVKVSVRSRRP